MRANRWVALVLGIALSACSSVQTTNPGAIGVERKQMMLVGEAVIVKAAVQAYAQEVDKAARPLYPGNARQTRRKISWAMSSASVLLRNMLSASRKTRSRYLGSNISKAGR